MNSSTEAGVDDLPPVPDPMTAGCVSPQHGRGYLLHKDFFLPIGGRRANPQRYSYVSQLWQSA